LQQPIDRHDRIETMSNRTDVSVESKNISVTPGETVRTSAPIRNSGDAQAQFTFRIEGLNSDWYNLPVSSTTLFPRDEEELAFSLHPPKDESTKPGLYPFTLVIDCRQNPGASERIAFTLEVRDIPEPQLELAPRRFTGNKGVYRVTVSNPGDRTVVVRLRVTGSDTVMRCTLQPESVTVPAGGSAESTLEVGLRWRRFFSSRQEYSFTILAEQAGSDRVKSVAGELVRKKRRMRLPSGLSSPAPLRRRKEPPDITCFEAVTEDRRRYRLNWSVEQAREVKLDDEEVELQGFREMVPAEVTTYVLTAVNKHGYRSKTVEVEPLPAPEEKYSDRVLVMVTPDSLSVTAGSEPVEAAVEVRNIGSIVDKFSVEVEGIPRSWYSLSAPEVALMPHAGEDIQLAFHPPKAEGVVSGTYPFAVTVRSQSIPDDSASAVGRLEILPSVDYSVSLKPYRVLSRRKCTFQVHIVSKDVTEAGLFIDVIDAENGLRFKLENDSPVIPPWQTVDIPMLVKPKRNSLIGDIKRYDINLTATTAEGYIQLARCQMDHKPFLSSWRPIFRTVKYIVFVGVAGFAVWYLIRLGGGWSSLTSDPQTWIDGTIRHLRGWFY